MITTRTLRTSSSQTPSRRSRGSIADFDEEEWIEEFTLLEDRANLSWQYGSLEETAEMECSYEKKSDGLYYFYRTIWLDCLLRPSRSSVAGITDYFYEQIHAGMKFEDARDGIYLKKAPITALYWIWRLFWFDSPELEECLDITEDHVSPIVRDCVALVRELLGGRKQLGEIEDIFARREEFLALDLDPARAEARAAEQAEAERLAEDQRLASLARVQEIAASSSVEEVREALWDYLGQEEALDVLYDHLEANDPESFPWINRRWFLTEGTDYELKFEKDDFEEVLRAHRPAVLAPRFPGSALGAAIAGTRVKDAVIAELETKDEYNHARTRGIRALGAMGDRSMIPRLVELTETTRWTPGEWLEELHNKDSMLAAIEALTGFGGDEARDALVALLDTGLTKIHARVLSSLGRMKAQDILAAVQPFLDTEFARPALFALAQSGEADVVHDCAGVLAGSYVSLAYERGMQQLANLRAGRPVDWELVVKLTAVIESKKYEDIELHEALIALLSEHPDNPVGHLTPYLHHEYESLRTLTAEKLAALDSSIELRWMDHWTVHQLLESDGVEALREALKDPHALLRGNIVWKAIEEGHAEELVEEICDYVGQVTRFEHYTNGYVQDEHKRTAWVILGLAQIDHPTARRALCRLWKHPNPMYRSVDVLKYNRDEIQDQLQPYVAEVEAEFAAQAAAPIKTESVEEFGASSWLFGGGVNGMEWSPDGEHLAVAGAGGVKLYNRQGAVVRSFAACNGAWVYDVTYSPDGSLIAAGAHGGHLWLLDPSTGELVAKLNGHSGVPSGVRKVRFSPSGNLLASVSDDESARVWDVATHAEKAGWNDPADVNTVDWLDDEKFVIGTDRMLRILDTDANEVAQASCAGIAEARVHRDRERIFVGTAHSHVRVFDLDLNEMEGERLERGAVARIRFRNDDLVACSWEGEGVGASIVSYDGSSVRHLDGNQSAAFGLDLDPRDGGIYGGGSAGIIARWTADGDEVENEELFHSNEVASFRMVDGELCTASSDHTAIRWSADGAALAVYRNPEGRACDAIRDGDHVFVTGSDFAGCFDLDGNVIWRVEPARSEFMELTEDTVIIASYNTLVWLDRQTGDFLHQSDEFADSFIYRWAVLDDGRLCCAGYDDEQLFIWDLKSRTLVETWTLPASEKGGMCANVGLGGGKLFVARWDKTIVVLDATTGKLLKKAALNGTRYPTAVSPDGKRFYATQGQQVEVYDTDTFEKVGVVEAPAPLEVLTMMPSGRLFMGAKSGAIFVYNDGA